jgi:O-acetyl-ADP-ribose deacetylase (regulator of RNase III)
MGVKFGRSTEVFVGDITALDVDAVVNAANSHLAEGSGVCGAIFAAAGRERLRIACAAVAPCPTGDAVATPGFDLPAKIVVHAVGPVYDRGDPDRSAALLRSAYERALAVAAEAGARSIAFPALSTGVYGYPREEAAVIAVDTVRRWDGPMDRCVLVAFDAVTASLYRSLLADG